MNKIKRSVSLTSRCVEFVDANRGAFSFSAYLEYLCWEGAIAVTEEGRAGGERDGVKPRRAMVRAR